MRARCFPHTPLAIITGLALASASSASNKYLELPPDDEAMSSPAYVHANAGDTFALSELDRLEVPYRRVAKTAGVRTPVRLTGPVRGVHIHSAIPEAERADSSFEILDARLAIALDDFAKILATHDIVELVHFTMYRPAAQTPSGGSAPQTRHPGGMAIDVGSLKKRDGRWLTVGSHFPPKPGAKTCGAGARPIKSRIGRELRSIVCEAADARVFHYMLTPHFDDAHADHFHLEIKPEVKWFLVN